MVSTMNNCIMGMLIVTTISAIVMSVLYQHAAKFMTLDNLFLQSSSGPDLQVLLLGGSGRGKSSLGNLILGEDKFDAGFRTTVSTRVFTKFGQRNVDVVDTPPMKPFREDRPEDIEYLATAVVLSPEGYHAFILVLDPISHITREEIDAIHSLHRFFGDDFFRYVLIVFTHRDGLSLPVRVVIEQNENFREISKLIHYPYVVVDNECKCPFGRRYYRIQILKMLDGVLRSVRYSPFSHRVFEKAKSSIPKQKRGTFTLRDLLKMIVREIFKTFIDFIGQCLFSLLTRMTKLVNYISSFALK